MISLGMLARPLGSIFFGFIGDFYGRKQALFLTLAGMSVVSGCIALTSTFAENASTVGGILLASWGRCFGDLFMAFSF